VTNTQPIDFAGDTWRNYVPHALPWTVCVRERLPPGSSAVLINRAHRFTDLICTVDSFEDRLLAAIDGHRNLAEILRLTGQDGDGTRRALSFFQRLWRYDQIVLDASQAAVAEGSKANARSNSAERELSAPSRSTQSTL
jgi:hypothetical protein